MNTVAALIGRILLALIFIVSGAAKLFDPAGTEAPVVALGKHDRDRDGVDDRIEHTSVDPRLRP